MVMIIGHLWINRSTSVAWGHYLCIHAYSYWVINAPEWQTNMKYHFQCKAFPPPKTWCRARAPFKTVNLWLCSYSFSQITNMNKINMITYQSRHRPLSLSPSLPLFLSLCIALREDGAQEGGVALASKPISVLDLQSHTCSQKVKVNKCEGTWRRLLSAVPPSDSPG